MYIAWVIYLLTISYPFILHFKVEYDQFSVFCKKSKIGHFRDDRMGSKNDKIWSSQAFLGLRGLHFPGKF